MNINRHVHRCACELRVHRCAFESRVAGAAPPEIPYEGTQPLSRCRRSHPQTLSASLEAAQFPDPPPLSSHTAPLPRPGAPCSASQLRVSSVSACSNRPQQTRHHMSPRSGASPSDRTQQAPGAGALPLHAGPTHPPTFHASPADQGWLPPVRSWGQPKEICAKKMPENAARASLACQVAAICRRFAEHARP